nr:hypothetical protein [Deltaproteobacteria bacterium]
PPRRAESQASDGDLDALLSGGEAPSPAAVSGGQRSAAIAPVEAAEGEARKKRRRRRKSKGPPGAPGAADDGSSDEGGIDDLDALLT